MRGLRGTRPVSAGRPRRSQGEDRGVAMVEFAIVLPLLVILVTGIFEFGIALNRAQAVEAAAREGARLASISSTNMAAIEARVDQTLAGIPVNNVDVIVPSGLCAGRQGGTVTVVVAADHDLDIPFVTAQTLTLTGQAVFRCEG